MKKIFITLLLIVICVGSAQSQLNDYKYIIIPKKFSEFKRENQYLTSTLVKHLFVEKGFNAIYEDALPEELNNDRCLALTAQIKDESSMFLTKTAIVLLDCQAREVYVTQQGTSKEKEFKLSYGEAIREAFKSFNEISYAYSKKDSKPVTVNFKDDVKQVPETKDVQPKNKEVVAAKVIVADKVPENKTATKAVVRPETAPEQLEPNVAETQISKKEKVVVAESAPATKPNTPEAPEIWYAQQILNGYQLVDSAPKVRLKMYKTSLANVYLSENEKGNGLVYEKDGQWLWEYYDGSNLKLEKLNIKF